VGRAESAWRPSIDFLLRGVVVSVWDISDDSLAQAAKGRTAINVARVDLLDAEAVSPAMTAVAEEFGRIDIVVNCIGKESRRISVEDYDVAEWRRCLEINLTATFIACKFAVQEMRRHDYGRIVNISSTSGKDGNPFDWLWCNSAARLSSGFR
jgi:2-dehydro-3-deoxy-L-rhamnonate dehydrogenase (NAD+)